MRRAGEEVQLSDAITPAVKSGTGDWQLSLANADWSGVQLMITGAMLSVTVKVVSQVLLFPDASVTVMVIVVTPVLTRVP
jgi:hypothetical protein